MTAVDLALLQKELTTAGVVVPNGLVTLENTLETVRTPDATGALVLLPPAADPVLAAHVAPPRLIEFAESIAVDAILRTTDDLEHDVFVLPAQPKSIYRAELQLSAMDAGNGACKFIQGILVWKRLLGVNVIAPPSNITVVSQIQDTVAAAWVVNGLPAGGSFRIFVKGAAGRSIDWALAGSIARYAPEGLGV